jgi:hypothetical protein
MQQLGHHEGFTSQEQLIDGDVRSAASPAPMQVGRQG